MISIIIILPFLVWTLKALLVQTRERKEDTIARLLYNTRKLHFSGLVETGPFLALQSF
jgi:hypothetical protein